MPEAVGATFYTDVQGIINGISSYRGYLLIFCLDGPIYSCTGGFDELGRGGYDCTAIDYGAGILAHPGIVQTEIGVFWPGRNGFYWTNGVSTLKISDGLSDTYAELTETFNQKYILHGTYNPTERRVYWAMATSKSSVDTEAPADRILVLDLQSGISEDMPFTVIRGETDFEAQGITIFEGELYRGDKEGFLWRHRESLRTDLYRWRGMYANTPDLWAKAPIVCRFKSANHDFGDTSVRKLVPMLTMNFKNRSNLSLRVYSENDNTSEEVDLRPTENQGTFVWQETDWLWGDPTFVWNNSRDFFDKRRFTNRKLRCFYKKIGFETAFRNIYTSDLMGKAEVNGTTWYVSLDGQTWPEDVMSYEIAFSFDNFKRGYPITFVDGDELQFDNTEETIPEETFEDVSWVIRGYPLNQFFHMQSYALDYALFTETQVAYRKGSLLGNPET